MGCIGASIEGAELRLLNQLARAEAQATLASLHHYAAEKIQLASDPPIDSIDEANKPAEQIFLKENQALASRALASLNLLHQQRSQIADIVKKISGPAKRAGG